MYSKSTTLLALLLWMGSSVARPIPDIKIILNITSPSKETSGAACSSGVVQTTLGYPPAPPIETTPPLPSDAIVAPSVDSPPKMPSEIETVVLPSEPAVTTAEIPSATGKRCTDKTEPPMPTKSLPEVPPDTELTTLQRPTYSKTGSWPTMTSAGALMTSGAPALSYLGSLSTASEDASFPANEPELTAEDPEAGPPPTDVAPIPTAPADSGDEMTSYPSQSAMGPDGGEQPVETGGAGDTDYPEETAEPRPSGTAITPPSSITSADGAESPMETGAGGVSSTMDEEYMSTSTYLEAAARRTHDPEDYRVDSSTYETNVPVNTPVVTEMVIPSIPAMTGSSAVDKEYPLTSSYIEAAARRTYDPEDYEVYRSTDEVDVPVMTLSATNAAISPGGMLSEGSDYNGFPAMPTSNTVSSLIPLPPAESDVANSSESASDMIPAVPTNMSNEQSFKDAGDPGSEIHVNVNLNPEDPSKSIVEVQGEAKPNVNVVNAGTATVGATESSTTESGNNFSGYTNDESWYGRRTSTWLVDK